MSKDPEYDRITAEDPIASMDTQHAAAAALANLSLQEARKSRAAPEERAAQTVKAGFSVSWDCGDAGVVGLWSCWLEDRFYLGYPTSWGPVGNGLLRQALDAFPGTTSWRPYVNSNEAFSNDRRDGDSRPFYVRVDGLTVPLIVDAHSADR